MALELRHYNVWIDFAFCKTITKPGVNKIWLEYCEMSIIQLWQR
jgi:hypothetical protein